jgi:hypothetical protein
MTLYKLTGPIYNAIQFTGGNQIDVQNFISDVTRATDTTQTQTVAQDIYGNWFITCDPRDTSASLIPLPINGFVILAPEAALSPLIASSAVPGSVTVIDGDDFWQIFSIYEGGGS